MAVAGTRLSIRSYGERLLTHTHDFHQVVFPVIGSMETRVGAIQAELSQGRMAVIAPGTAHSFRAFSANRFVVLDVACLATEGGQPFRPLDAGLNELVRYADAALAVGKLATVAEFHLAELFVGHIQRDGVRRPNSAIMRALSMMEQEHDGNLSVAALADAAGLSRSQFHNTFQRETGRTPAGMLRDIRLDRAAVLLRQTDRPIAEIALMVGFSDQTALTRCFRRFRATTPQALRRNEAADSIGRHSFLAARAGTS